MSWFVAGVGRTMRKKSKRAILLGAAVGALGSFVPAFHAQAASYAWTQTGNGTTGIWSQTTNWSPNGTPDSSADIVNFGGANSNNNGTITLNTTSRSVGTFLFTRNGSATLANTGGASLSIYNGITASAPSTVARSYTITAPITLAANNVWDIDSSVGAEPLCPFPA